MQESQNQQQKRQNKVLDKMIEKCNLTTIWETF